MAVGGQVVTVGDFQTFDDSTLGCLLVAVVDDVQTELDH